MEQPQEHTRLAPEVFQVWERQAETSAEFAEEWRDYAMMMAAFHRALERAPRTAETCASVDIEGLLISELEQLAETVNAIFPQGGMMEFAFYQPQVKP